MNIKRRATQRWMIIAGIAGTYFVLFPGDLARILLPVREILALTHAVSPWAYVFAIAVLLAWLMGRLWDRRSVPPAS